MDRFDRFGEHRDGAPGGGDGSVYCGPASKWTSVRCWSSPRSGSEVTRDELLHFYDGKIAKWWKPDDVVFIDSIPLGATGKMQKNKLRAMFKDYKLPTA